MSTRSCWSIRERVPRDLSEQTRPAQLMCPSLYRGYVSLTRIPRVKDFCPDTPLFQRTFFREDD
jgi:hypothetical protein